MSKTKAPKGKTSKKAEPQASTRKGLDRPLPPTEPKRLASTQLRILAFVDHYRMTFNAKASALAAGYAESFAESAGSKLLHDPRVQELLSRHALDAMAVTNVKTEEILRAACEIAYLDPGQCFEQLIESKHGIVTLRLRDITEMPLAVRRCISGFKVIKKNLTSGDGFIDTVIEVKFWNKNEALKLLAMYKSMLTQKAEEQVTQRQLEKMSDEDLARTYRDAVDKWDRHVAARQQSRLALVKKA